MIDSDAGESASTAGFDPASDNQPCSKAQQDVRTTRPKLSKLHHIVTHHEQNSATRQAIPDLHLFEFDSHRVLAGSNRSFEDRCLLLA